MAQARILPGRRVLNDRIRALPPDEKDELQRTKEEMRLAIERARRALDTALLRAVLTGRQSSDPQNLAPGPNPPNPMGALQEPEPPSPPG